jgi:tetratricopeptide (TPR) repeat protein
MNLTHSQRKYLKQNWKTLAFLAFLVLAVYLNSLGNDFVSDDIGAIKENPIINQINYFWTAPYFAISPRSLSIFLIHKIFGLAPFFYRLANVLSHLGVVFTAYFLTGFFFAPPIPLITAGLFAVHPILTESITWISGGPYSLYSLFLLVSFLLYLAIKGNGSSVKFYFLSLLFFLLSLFTSEKAIVFPLILIFFEISSGKTTLVWKKLAPFLLLSFSWGAFYFLSGRIGARVSSLTTQFYQESKIYNPLIQIPIAVTSYLELIFWPKNLTLYHSEMSFTQTQFVIRFMIFISFISFILISFFKNRRLFFWFSFFLISLLPTLTPFGISWIVAERYVYLGSIGIFVVIAIAIQRLGQILTKDTKTSFLIFIPILLLFSIRTIIRNNDWKNQDTLWLATAKTSPSSPQNHNNLGDYYGRQGDFQRSIEEFKIAIQLNPRYADAYHNLANTYAQIGEVNKAIENYYKAIEFGPHLWQSHQNLAAIYFSQEKFGLVKEELEKALQINPQNPNLYVSLAVVYFKLADLPNAQNSLKTALQLDPQNRQAKELLLYGLTP